MPQARLPDINTAFVMYRREAITNYKSKNYSLCIGSIYALNALLPDKYRVKISDIEYEKKTQKKLLLPCPKCLEQFDFNEIPKVKIIVPTIEQFLTTNETTEIWKCPKCDVTNPFDRNELIKQIPQEPFFIHVVPHPPTQKDGLISRNRFFRKFSVWYWMILNELEERMAQFRDDNWQKESDYYEDEAILDGGEED